MEDYETEQVLGVLVGMKTIFVHIIWFIVSVSGDSY